MYGVLGTSGLRSQAHAQDGRVLDEASETPRGAGSHRVCATIQRVINHSCPSCLTGPEFTGRTTSLDVTWRNKTLTPGPSSEGVSIHSTTTSLLTLKVVESNATR